MAATNISPNSEWLEALDTLCEARGVATFIQNITLTEGQERDLHLGAGAVTGLYYTLQDLINRIRRVEYLVGQHEFTKKPEIAARTAELEGAQS